jgi:hypothetical protein
MKATWCILKKKRFTGGLSIETIVFTLSLEVNFKMPWLYDDKSGQVLVAAVGVPANNSALDSSC